MRPRYAAIAVLLCLLLADSAAAAPFPRSRPSEPIVLGGAELPRLTGAKPGRVLAFIHRERNGTARWHPVPIQVDERKRVDFGEVPQQNDVPGVEGTVYGTPPAGVTALQYADPRTFVGPDSDPTFDDNDEVALVKTHFGVRADRGARAPKGTRPGSATRIRISDPLVEAPTGFIYLFRAKGRSAERNEQDYVSYDFSLDSGGYRATYRRADGPNPETSRIHAYGYEAGFSDRWFYDRLVGRFSLNGTDMLDGYKFSFGPTSCGRSEATFNDGEGAFVANIDGPVRAIRSYVGANSGPYTERTHFFYRWRHVIVTDLRVHAVPGPLIYHDMSEGATGMTYLDSNDRAGVAVDGDPDTLDDSVASWHFWTSAFPPGAEGSLWSADRIESSFSGPLMAAASGWYLDDSSPEPNLQCWGDSQALGQAGIRSTYSMPNTDPGTGATDDLRLTTTELVSIGTASPEAAVETADGWSAELDAPYELRLRP